MTKNEVLTAVKSILKENGIEYRVVVNGEGIFAKSGRIHHFLYFSDNSVSIISSVKVGEEDIETSHIDKWFKDITKVRFDNNQMWLDGDSLGYTTIVLKQGS